MVKSKNQMSTQDPMGSDEPTHGPIPESLALLLQNKRDVLLERWMHRVLEDPEVPSANRLSRPALEDHFPMLIRRLVARLARKPYEEGEGELVGREVGSSKDVGVAHARHRFAAQFTVGEALRELSHFRAALLEIFEESLATVPIEEAKLVHTTIDELMAVSASELERTELGAVQQVMAIVAHDLRNPLQVVTGHAQFLKEGNPLEGSECAAVGAALERSAQRMTRFLEDLLITSTLELGHLSVQNQRVDVRSIVSNVCEQIRYAADRKSIAVTCTVPDQEVIATCDPERIEQALGNIVSNAIKFTPTGGRVRVDLKASLRQVMFRIFDSGPGISPEHHHLVFRPFWKASKTSSPGLGLSIARGIIEVHGGTIFVESQPGQGTTFCFTVPLEPSDDSSESIDVVRTMQ